ncbi:GGDEF domain-containing protein [Saccharospirillum impatiens]|uniref:GGDEF domain-containing protein n=1 Tax=Saccharospirillum impatiens TaxID=169438 RepID=UPI00048AC843|nr:GGDEF domain-containing protein [Saccharospirillum impatiens]
MPSDAELRSQSLRHCLWIGVFAYALYTLVLEVTAPPSVLGLFLVFCGALHALAILAYYLSRPILASIWMIAVLLFCITVMNLYGFTREQSAEYYFLLVPPLIFMVLPPEQRQWQLSLLTVTVVLLTLVFVLPRASTPWFPMSTDDHASYKWLDLMVCMLAMSVVCRSFITRLLRQRDQLERLALIDPLTGLPNRNASLERMATLYNQAIRFSVVILDIDDFREVNRRRGQEVADVLVRKLAQRLRTHLPESVYLARVGGDQFMVVSDRAITPESVESLMARLQEVVIRRSFELGNGSERVRVSLGGTLSEATESPQALNRRLMQALAQARLDDRNRFLLNSGPGPEQSLTAAPHTRANVR